MALRVRDAAQAAERFATKAASAAGDYAKGIQGSGAAWEGGAAAAEQNYNDGVTQAVSRGAFGRGVRASGGSYYEQRAATLGASRFAPGVQAGKANYSEGVQPYLDTLRSLNLTPRRPKGDPSNVQRVAEVANALRQKKVSR
jgi:hypothetical protein